MQHFLGRVGHDQLLLVPDRTLGDHNLGRPDRAPLELVPEIEELRRTH